MIRLAIQHKILEACIDTFFNQVQNNILVSTSMHRLYSLYWDVFESAVAFDDDEPLVIQDNNIFRYSFDEGEYYLDDEIEFNQWDEVKALEQMHRSPKSFS